MGGRVDAPRQAGNDRVAFAAEFRGQNRAIFIPASEALRAPTMATGGG